jgi:hypothetical protein
VLQEKSAQLVELARFPKYQGATRTLGPTV